MSLKLKVRLATPLVVTDTPRELDNSLSDAAFRCPTIDCANTEVAHWMMAVTETLPAATTRRTFAVLSPVKRFTRRSLKAVWSNASMVPSMERVVVTT